MPHGSEGQPGRNPCWCLLMFVGHPHRRFARDTALGDTKGQGAGGTWFAVTPDGKKAAASTDVPPAGPGYGY
jgi:hypothetical protein